MNCAYNNMQIFQTRGHVVILNEMVHDARIIPPDGRPHLPDSVRQWMEDSRGLGHPRRRAVPPPTASMICIDTSIRVAALRDRGTPPHAASSRVRSRTARWNDAASRPTAMASRSMRSAAA